MSSDLDPQARAVVDRLDASLSPPGHALSVESAREQLRVALAGDDVAVEVDQVADFEIPGPDAPIPVRVYRPAGDGPFPVVVYFHGGGWVRGDLDTHDGFCRRLTHESGCLVVSVDYRRAPEHPFPAPLSDCYAATRWAGRHATDLGGDPSRLVVGGGSAGGNLAAATALLARVRGDPDLAHQLLLWPVVDYAFDTDSYRDLADGYFLTRAAMRWYWEQYLDHEVDGANPYAAPLRARDLSGLPPATVLTCGFDPLCDEGVAYAARLGEAGVPVTHVEYDDQIHAFPLFADEIVAAEAAIADVAASLEASL